VSVAVTVGVAVVVAVAVLVAVAVDVDVAVGVGVSVEVAVAVAVGVAVAVAVSVAVEVKVAVAVAVAVGVAVAGGLEFGLVVKTELNPSFSISPLAALTDPTKYILYLVLTARPLVGVKIALLPLQAMLRAGISLNPTGLSRKVCLFIDSHFIGRLKFTVILVWTSTSTAPFIGLVDSTTGRGFFDAAAADDPAMHRIIASAATEIRVTVYFRIIVPLDLLIANLPDPTIRKLYARSLISGCRSE
jgi:hypothetical protein